MKEVFIVAAKRTALGSFGGMYKSLSAIDLGAAAIKGALESSGVNPEMVDEMIFGNVVSANLGQGPARQAALAAGLPAKVPCTTVNKLCASGMKSAMLGAATLQLGQNNLVVAGGMENMTNIPFYLEKARYGYGYGNSTLIDGLYKDGLQDAYAHNPMGCFADATAASGNFSREQQDEYAINSYKRAAEAWQNGNMAKEVVPVEITDKKGNKTQLTEDEEYKKVFFDKIPTLKPVFTKDGTVTAANASTINDGAAALILASADAVGQHRLKPIAKIVSYADGAREPEWFTLAPVIAAEKALRVAGKSISDIDYFEVNEAFAVVPMAFAAHFGIEYSKMNVFGGAVSIGHPLGASGARIITTLINVLQTKGAKTGMAAICNGGGGASAMIIELV